MVNRKNVQTARKDWIWRVKNAVREGWSFSENTPIAPLFLSPDGGMNVCAALCVMTDVIPCCFPAEDGLNVH